MIKYHFFGKECLINRDLTNYLCLEENLSKHNFNRSNPVVFVNQIHSDNVAVIDDETKIPTLNNRPQADAIVTNLRGLVIGLFTADCVPILFFDEKNSVIAAAHTGWRGALKNIAGNTIAKMVEIGAHIDNIKAVIGPAIRQESYEISQEFYDRFLDESLDNKKFFIAIKKAGYYLFDLPSYAGEKLKYAGIKDITDDKIDTYSNEAKFFSYRRRTHLGKEDCGRNISVIQIS